MTAKARFEIRGTAEEDGAPGMSKSCPSEVGVSEEKRFPGSELIPGTTSGIMIPPRERGALTVPWARRRAAPRSP